MIGKRFVGFDRERINFIHSTYHEAMVCICAENAVDNIETFLLLLSSADSETRPFCLRNCPASEEVLGTQKVERRHSWDW